MRCYKEAFVWDEDLIRNAECAKRVGKILAVALWKPWRQLSREGAREGLG